MALDSGFRKWFVRDTSWSRAAVPMAVLLMALTPFLRRGLGRGAFSVFLQLPIYMFHQYEEHGHGAFKAYANETLLRRHGRLTDANIFVINVGGVWAVDLVVLYLACYRRLALGLLAPYLALVNSLIHLGPALRTRRSNPGAWTSGLLLLPGGLYSVLAITRSGPVSLRDHIRAFVGAILLHLATILIVLATPSVPRDREA